MFEPLPTPFDFPAAERRVLEFWERHGIFARSLRLREGGRRFVFYEGPPTANGKPHPGHALTRTIKDLFPRYRTMCGEYAERRAGWDTHGLPVETEVCKELGLRTKADIEAYGVERFVERCLESVFRYTADWEEMTRRLGFWVDLDAAYVTYHQSYVESVWWSLKTLFERGLLYQGHKIVWWWPQGGTALSAGEVGEGYRTVDDPSIYVRLPLLDALPLPGSRGQEGRASLVAWTTTPWTLPANQFAAVKPELAYAVVADPASRERLVLAESAVPALAAKLGRELRIVGSLLGRDLVGLRYEPPFDASWAPVAALQEGSGPAARTAPLRDGGRAPVAWRTVPGDFVDAASGSGVVHVAPAFGMADFDLLQLERGRFADPDALSLACPVGPDGKFSSDAPERFRGRFVKDCDRDLVQELRQRGLLWHRETIRHEYPFSPRAEGEPLIQYARQSWFVRTSAFREAMLRNNAAVRWLPDHVRDGRFGDFLRNNVDWALSRERYWGTPLPIWVCERTGRMVAVASLAELAAKPEATDGGFWAERKARNPGLSEHLRVHKPYIDAWTWASPFAEGARMRRVPEVIDVWWDAGSMPFAQWGYPHRPGSERALAENFPADFISEAVDQTRGWFYALLAIQTILFDPRARGEEAPQRPSGEYPMPFRTCVVLGHLMGEDGTKMSKRLRNYREPSEIFDTLGADAMRWYLLSAQAPWSSARFQAQAIAEAHRDFLLRLQNVMSFFSIYARIDGFLPGLGARPVAERSELDRWILSELSRTVAAVRQSLDGFENQPAARRLAELVEGLANWWLRRSRARFWSAERGPDKWDAYETLHTCLLTLSRLIAPFTPFFAETMWQALTGLGFRGEGAGELPASVHLADYPVADPALVDDELARDMGAVRDVVSAGHGARSAARLKVRQPLAAAVAVVASNEEAERLARHADLVREELNVKVVDVTTDVARCARVTVRPELKRLGARFGRLLPEVRSQLASLDGATARRQLAAGGSIAIAVGGEAMTLGAEEVLVRTEALPGWAVAPGRHATVAVATELTRPLVEEGIVRELLHHLQAERKALGLAYEAQVRLRFAGPEPLAEIVRRWEATIARDALVAAFEYGEIDCQGRTVTLDGRDVLVALSPSEDPVRTDA